MTEAAVSTNGEEEKNRVKHTESTHEIIKELHESAGDGTELDVDLLNQFMYKKSPTALKQATNVSQNAVNSAPAVGVSQSAINSISKSTDDVVIKSGPKHANLVEIPESIISIERADKQPVLNSPGTLEWSDMNLSPELLRGIYQKGFNRPSRIQEAAIPLIIGSSTSMIAQAQNGSGKTATFVLCLLSAVNPSINDPQGLCLCPTRELASQSLEVLKDLGKYTTVTKYLSVPQCEPYPSKGAQIIIGTPGKTTELLKKKLINVTNIKILVLDEADDMIDERNNMGPQVQNIRRILPSRIQILLFSATYPDEVKRFATSMVPYANKIMAKKEDLSLANISQFYITCENEDDKFTKLSDLYGSMVVGQSVIFANSRNNVFNLEGKMRAEGHAVSVICGSQNTGSDGLDHATRDKIMSEFRNSETKVLICTDLLSRGIDVPQVTLVINYDLPYLTTRKYNSIPLINTETYLHRIGRTGRFKLKGVAINLVNKDQVFLLDQIRQHYQCEISELNIDIDDIEKMMKSLRI